MNECSVLESGNEELEVMNVTAAFVDQEVSRRVLKSQQRITIFDLTMRSTSANPGPVLRESESQP